MTGTAACLEPTIIWCLPRSCSTAFERAFIQRSHDTITFHEPTGDAAYFSKERQIYRFKEKECRSDPHRYERGLKEVMEDLVQGKGKDIGGKKYIFIKDMAQYIFPASTLQALHPGSRVYHPTSPEYQPPVKPSEPVVKTPLPDFSKPLAADFGTSVKSNPTALPTALLRQFKHTFLIRTPNKSVLSYYKCAQEGAGGFEYFDGAEAGYKELALLHAWISNPQSDFHVDADAAASNKEDGQEHVSRKKRGVGTDGVPISQPMPPPLIEASTLLAEPNHVLEQYCNAIGIPFYKGMLSWESSKKKEATDADVKAQVDANRRTVYKENGNANVEVNGSSNASLADFAKWGTYHRVAEESTGFRKESTPANGAGDNVGATEKEPLLPKEVQETIEANKSAYDYLLSNQTIHLHATA
ncbi:hypothetical protein K437DRAFT_153051 [Tilletiaria anomala UBC 951]|uniref:P-loop containing nucleoside triphosphate hydrolase protein n=1 Tax=Tilletiaria anomala (strain ATCC 24038 / CBS 436.72 / UBC 951) TaxID=1037660 RepID=A0A066VPD4_TILAU|nr:uncharacterized protein K437DRAFT_153051 [Tilletiaria anomala UBC 951]KDN43311.1 hypothetical protein K437DRAFT_153051 [Tilletiaria anomala UBC 951]